MNAPPPVFIVSGGAGTSGEQIVNTVLAQFPDNAVPVVTIGNVRLAGQIEEAVAQAKSAGGIIVHTLVDAELRRILIRLAGEQGVFEADLMGPLLEKLADILGRAPLGRPGLYRALKREYFDRIGAIDYTMSHDDGQRPQDWAKADVLIIGVSRTGKTPMSVYFPFSAGKRQTARLSPGCPFRRSSTGWIPPA